MAIPPTSSLDHPQQRPEQRAERLNSGLDSFKDQFSLLDQRLSLIDAHLDSPSLFLSNTNTNTDTDTNNHNTNNNTNINFSSSSIPSFTPKPRPILPSRTRNGYPLSDNDSISLSTLPTSLPSIPLQPSPADIIAWPQRGPAAHRVSFLLNPVMNPANDHIRDLSPPPSRPSNSIDLHQPPLFQIHSPSIPDSNPSHGPSRPSIHSNSSPSPELVPLPTTHVTVSLPGTAMVPLSMASSVNHACPNARPLENAGSHASTLSDTEVQKYWDLFFSKYSNRLTWSPTEASSVHSVRASSDLLFSSIISVSAKVLGQEGFVELCVEDSKTMTRSTIFPLRHHNIQDLKGIMILAIYHGYHSVCSHFVTLCLTLSLHKVFVKLTDPILRGATMEEELVEKGRTWLLVVIYSHVLSIFSKKMYLICSPPKVIKDHTSILRSSKFEKDCDRLIQAHIELVIVLSQAQTKLDSRNYPGPMGDRKEKFVEPELAGVIEELESWTRRWENEAPELVGGLRSGAREELRKPRQYVMLYILHTVLWPCCDGSEIVKDEARLERAREGCRLAAGMLGRVIELKSLGCEGSELMGEELIAEEEERIGLEIEYHKATLGLATGYLIWMSLIIPGFIRIYEYRRLLGKLHLIEFKESCEHIDLIEKGIVGVDEWLRSVELRGEGVGAGGLGRGGQSKKKEKKKMRMTSSSGSNNTGIGFKEMDWVNFRGDQMGGGDCGLRNAFDSRSGSSSSNRVSDSSKRRLKKKKMRNDSMHMEGDGGNKRMVMMIEEEYRVVGDGEEEEEDDDDDECGGEEGGAGVIGESESEVEAGVVKKDEEEGEWGGEGKGKGKGSLRLTKRVCKIDEVICEELERLITDTRFWFQVDIE